jgi:hypothetical protein
MLLTMKVYVEGMRSLLYYVGHLEDRRLTAADPGARDRYQGLIDFLIPIAKGYVTERACEVCNLGIQIYGGYGYIREYPVEQLLRDCRITPIYEGTNGIRHGPGPQAWPEPGPSDDGSAAEIQAILPPQRPAHGPFAESVTGGEPRCRHALGAAALSDKVLTAFVCGTPSSRSAEAAMAWMLCGGPGSLRKACRRRQGQGRLLKAS